MKCDWCRTKLDPERSVDMDRKRFHPDCALQYRQHCRELKAGVKFNGELHGQD